MDSAVRRGAWLSGPRNYHSRRRRDRGWSRLRSSTWWGSCTTRRGARPIVPNARRSSKDPTVRGRRRCRTRPGRWNRRRSDTSVSASALDGPLGGDFRGHPLAGAGSVLVGNVRRDGRQGGGQDTGVVAEAGQREEVGDGVQREDEVGQGRPDEPLDPEGGLG